MAQGRSDDCGVRCSAIWRSSGEPLADRLRMRLSEGKDEKRDGPSGMRIPVSDPNCKALVSGWVARQLMTLSTASSVIQGIKESNTRGAVLTLNPNTGSVDVS